MSEITRRLYKVTMDGLFTNYVIAESVAEAANKMLLKYQSLSHDEAEHMVTQVELVATGVTE